MGNEQYVLGPDVDLDAEEIYLSDGSRLTESRAEQLAKDALETLRGRPSLSTDSGGRSPRVSFRVPNDVRAAAEQLAETEGVSLSVFARQALEDRVRNGQ